MNGVKAQWIKGRNLGYFERYDVFKKNGGIELGLKYCTNCYNLQPKINRVYAEPKTCPFCGAKIFALGVEE